MGVQRLGLGHKLWRPATLKKSSFNAICACFCLLMVLGFIALRSTDSGHLPKPASHHPSDQPKQPTQPTSAYLDSLDLVRPRSDESFITFGAFLDCVAARLRVDRHQRRELPIRDDDPHIPYMFTAITFELGELKAFTCDITVPIKHFMIVVNSNLSSVNDFMDSTAAAFAFTDRLQIRRFPRNLGYAGAINEAMRHALTFPFDEVPFFFMSNVDIRFRPGMWENSLPPFRADALTGKPLLEALRAEVATEPNEYTPPHFRDVPLRSTDGKHLLHTSASLPDRVRYMNKSERGVVFKGMHGAYYPDQFKQTGVWGLSRLAMETAGFFDANCYPAYYEDTDYLDRLQLLGLHSFSPLPSFYGVHHLGENLLKAEQANTGSRSFGETLAFLRGTVNVIRMSFPSAYIAVKPHMVITVENDKKPRRGLLMPPDAWVLNEERRLAIEELAQMSIRYYAATGQTSEPRIADVVIAEAPFKRRRKLRAALPALVNATEQYREGNKLRALRSPM